MALYYNPSSSCSYYSNETNFKYIPESTLASIHSSHNCTWLESIISRNYTAQDVWRDLLPTTVYNPNFTNCYGDQYMDYFNLSIAHDHDYSYFRLFLIPRGLSSLADSCLTPACQWSGAGNPDIAGIGMLVAYAFELVFIAVFYLSQLTGSGTTSNEANNDVVHRCLCPPATAHEKCTGRVGKCGYFAVVIHSELCDAFRGRKKSASGGWQHKRALKETTPSFLDAAIFFALSVEIGLMGMTPSQGLTGYEAMVLGYVFVLICSPLYVVLAFSSRTLRRKSLRRNLVSLVVVLSFCSISIVPPAAFPPVDTARRWDAICYSYLYGHGSQVSKGTIPIFTMYSTFAFECLRALVWLCRLALKHYLPNWWSSISTPQEESWGPRRLLQRALGLWKRYIYHWTSEKRSVWVVATIGFVFTLFGGISIAVERAGMQVLAGKDYQESRMTYGQYLAMLIWVPVLVEYAYVALFGVTRALESRLPSYYAIARRAELLVEAGAEDPDQVGVRGSGEELELELQQTYSSRSSLTSRSELALESQAFPGSAPDRRRTFPV